MVDYSETVEVYDIKVGAYSELNEPCHEKTCLRDLRPCKTQTGLLS